MLSLGLFADVMNNEHETIGIARMIGDDEAANTVGPIPVQVGFVRHLNHDIVEGLAGHNTVDGVVTMVEQVAAVTAHHEILAVLVDSPAELVEGRDAVHLQGGLVGIGDRLVWLNQNHALGQAGDDLLQLGAVRSLIAAPHSPLSDGPDQRHW